MEVYVSLTILFFSIAVVALAWLIPHKHEGTVIAVSLLVMAIGNVVQTVVEAVLWWTMRSRFDRTPVGVGLKGKWFSLAWKNLAVAAMYMMFALWLSSPFEPVPELRLWFYAIATAATVAAAVWGLALVHWLREESRQGLKKL